MNYELKRYSFGETIGKGFTLYFENFIPIVLLSLICQIPILFYTYYFKPQIFYGTEQILPIAAGIVITWINIVLQSILSAFIIHIVSEKFLKDSFDHDSSQRFELKSFFSLLLPIIGLSLLLGLIIILGLMACIIPGIIVSLGLCVAAEVFVIERRGISESIGRSWALTKGKKGEFNTERLAQQFSAAENPEIPLQM